MSVYWSEEEIKILCKVFSHSKITRQEILKLFPMRTWSAITGKACDLKLYKAKGSINQDFLKQLQKKYEI